MKPLAIIPALIASSFAFSSPLSAKNDDPAKAWLTPGQVASDIAIAESAYSRIHPGYTRYASADEMRGAWQAILAKAEADEGMTVGDLYLALNLALTNIRCDHTKAELPDALRKARSGKPLYLPFRWELVEGRGLIDTAPQGSGLTRGDEILSDRKSVV